MCIEKISDYVDCYVKMTAPTENYFQETGVIQTIKICQSELLNCLDINKRSFVGIMLDGRYTLPVT